MTLTLHIENETSLPDGGPLSVSIKGKRGLDIGRDPYLDWTLPDPSRFISGRHCEVRWQDGAYWLHDISTNGTFLNGAESRLKAPHRLRNGDRFVIGQYVIAATLDEEVVDREQPAPLAAAPRHDDLWGGVSDAAVPVDPRQLKAPRDAAPVRPDFLDWAADVPAPVVHPASPGVGSGAPVRARGAVVDTGDDGWAKGSPPPPVPQPEVMPVPNPRRPEPGHPNRVWTAASAEPSDAGVPLQSEPAGQRSQPEPWSVPPPAPTATSQGRGDSNAMASFVQLIARGAGLPDDAFAGRDPAELAEQFGKLLRLAT